MSWNGCFPILISEMLFWAIARTEDRKLAGVIGYALNTYKTGSLELTGVIPLSWMISPSHRGILGIQLLKKVLKEGDFGFAIQGSEVAQQSYKAVRLKYIGEAHIYTKVLRPLAHIRSGREFSSGSAEGPLFPGKKESSAPQTEDQPESGAGQPGDRVFPGTASCDASYGKQEHVAKVLSPDQDSVFHPLYGW